MTILMCQKGLCQKGQVNGINEPVGGNLLAVFEKYTQSQLFFSFY